LRKYLIIFFEWFSFSLCTFLAGSKLESKLQGLKIILNHFFKFSALVCWMLIPCTKHLPKTKSVNNFQFANLMHKLEINIVDVLFDKAFVTVNK